MPMPYDGNIITIYKITFTITITVGWSDVAVSEVRVRSYYEVWPGPQ